MKSMKKAITTAALLIAAGLLICLIAYGAVGFDLSKFDDTERDLNTYEVKDAFSGISINADAEDITFERSEDGTCKVLCFESEDEAHDVQIVNDILTIKPLNERNWQLFDLSFLSGSPYITVCLPDAAYGALCISSDTGDVDIPGGLTFDTVDIDLSTGDVTSKASCAGGISIRTSTGKIDISLISSENILLRTDTGTIKASDIICAGVMEFNVSTGRAILEDMACTDLISSGGTGDISLKNIISSGRIDLIRSTGDVRFAQCDAEEIYVKTDTGSVSGTLLSGKDFAVCSDTGTVSIPRTASGGDCEIETNTGDICIEIADSQ